MNKIYYISHNPLLGKVPDIVIAKKYGVTNNCVFSIRRKLKIKASHKHDSAYTKFNRKIEIGTLNKKVIPLMGKCSDAEIGRRYGVTRERIRQIRKRLKIPVYRNKIG